MAQIQVRDDAGQPIPRINIRIAEGTKPSAEAIYDVFTDLAGNTGWPIPFWPVQDYTLYVNDANVDARFESVSHGITAGMLGSDVLITLPRIAVPVPPVNRPGALVIDGERFRTPTGDLHSCHSYSKFLDFRRYLAGERDTLVADYAYLRARGVNEIRIFLGLPWVETPDYRVENVDWSRLAEYADFVADNGLRLEISVWCYSDKDLTVDEGAQRRMLQTVEDIAASRPWIFIEEANEPHVNRIDVRTLATGVTRRGAWTATGIYHHFYNDPRPPAYDDQRHFGTIHTDRDSAWFRKARHAQEFQERYHIPVKADEPAKAVEEGFQYPGARRNPDEHVWYHTICALWIAGSTYHCEFGKWGLIPTPGSLQERIFDRIWQDVWSQVSPEWQVGDYSGAHLSICPVDGKDLVIDGTPIWTYATNLGDRALAVRCAVSAPEPKPGWTVVRRWGPGGSIVELRRA